MLFLFGSREEKIGDSLVIAWLRIRPILRTGIRIGLEDGVGVRKVGGWVGEVRSGMSDDCPVSPMLVARLRVAAVH